MRKFYTILCRERGDEQLFHDPFNRIILLTFVYLSAPLKIDWKPLCRKGYGYCFSTIPIDYLRRGAMHQKNLMVLDQGYDGFDRFSYLGATYNIVLIHEATDALSFIKRLPVDVVLLKDQMSGMDALEFLMNLQPQDHYKAVLLLPNLH